ncbi:hypothetical protein BST47_22640 [Mycolicibacterium tusciae]|uniref:PASTA domain-containing protein n=1 Tax=Mycolicibacterium tusciae TaxID=75922 RepID=A0A1X0JJ21_9MYCO|nr:hypothetical protein BST47_22640 [Mycolicibacterium tusciae]
MKIFLAAFAVALSAASVVSPAAASGAPSGPRSVTDTVASLEAQGFKVIVNKVGHAPLDQCTVGGVRQGQVVTELKRNRRDQTVKRVKYTTVYIDANC